MLKGVPRLASLVYSRESEPVMLGRPKLTALQIFCDRHEHI